MTEERPQYLVDAQAMTGAGYETPSIEIGQAQTIIQRTGNKLHAIDRPAFVKISTSFKQELSSISGDALKVWIFIALSINRNTETANPGLRTIAKGVKLAVNTVQKCLDELEELNLLVVSRGEKRYNIYETSEYVSANKADPSVSNGDTVSQSVSKKSQSVSNSKKSLQNSLASVILNQNLTREPDSCVLSESEMGQVDVKMQAILEAERAAAEAKKSGKAWKQRSKFSFNENILALADLCVLRFGEPSGNEVSTWLMEIGHWSDVGAKPVDWKRAVEIVSGYSQPVLSVTGMTKAVKFATQERKARDNRKLPTDTTPQPEKVAISKAEAIARGLAKPSIGASA